MNNATNTVEQLKERLRRIVKEPKRRVAAEVGLLLVVMVIAGVVVVSLLTGMLFPAAPPGQLLSARMASLPYRTKFIQGETIDLSGMTMRLTYDNATRKIVSDGFTVEPSVLDRCGEQTIVVGIDGHYDSFTVNVVEADKSGSCGENLKWASVGSTLIITGHGPMDDYAGGTAPWKQDAANFFRVYLPDGLTTIGDGAFKGFTQLEEIRIPETVTRIGAEAFKNCTGMYELRIPASVKELGQSCFYASRQLKRLYIYSTKCTFGETLLEQVNNVVIYGYANSDAVKYAQNNNVEFDLIEP